MGEEGNTGQALTLLSLTTLPGLPTKSLAVSSFYLFIFKFIYLTVPGFSYSTWDLVS